MSGTLSNKNAERWTERTVLKCLAKIEEDVKENQIPFLGRAMINQGLSRKTWSYWKEKFGEEKKIIERMEWLESVFETHLFEGALGSKHVASVSIFALKNNHHWTDKPQLLVTKEETGDQGSYIILDANTTIRL